jgi:hypothetical protein
MVRAGGLAVTASYATGIDLADNPGIKIKPCGRCDANGNTWGMMTSFTVFFAMHAWPWKITNLGIWEFPAIVDLIELHPGNATLFIRLVTSDGHVVFSGASNFTGAAAGALV